MAPPDKEEPPTPEQLERVRATIVDTANERIERTAEQTAMLANIDRELDAIRAITAALVELSPENRARVLEAVSVLRGHDALAEQIREWRTRNGAVRS